jgi:hypothetical protein
MRRSLRRHGLPDLPEIRRLLWAARLRGFTFGADPSPQRMRAIRAEARIAVIRALPEEVCRIAVPQATAILCQHGLTITIHGNGTLTAPGARTSPVPPGKPLRPSPTVRTLTAQPPYHRVRAACAPDGARSGRLPAQTRP